MRKFDPAKCYAFDFECNSKEPANVYLCAVARFSKLRKRYVKTFFNIADSVNYIFSCASGSKFYAHNLKYDISFIECYLFQNFKEQFEISKSIIQDLTKSVVTVTIKFRGKSIKFIDTLPIFSAPLANVLKAFTNMEKGETPLFDYIEDVKLNDDIIDYCITDALGLAHSILARMEYGKGSLTTASDAFKMFRDTVDGASKGRFARFYQPLDVDLDDAMRPAYRGGFTFLNPAYAEKMLTDIDVLDVNSMYPAQMYNKLLPYGEPKIIEAGEVTPGETYILGIQKFIVKSAYLKDGYAPFISSANSLMHSANYLSEVSEALPVERRTFSLTLQEFELFKQAYDVTELTLLGGFLFKARSDMFQKYIDHFWGLKLNENKTISTIGKLFLNALYGKFAEGYTKNEYETIYEDERLQHRIINTELRPCGYLPVGIFITSYARIFLLESIHAVGYNDFVYCDTDSIHYIKHDGNSESLHMDKKELGAWKHETHFTRVKYIRAKRYCGEYFNEKENKVSLKLVCAGIKTKHLEAQVPRIEDFQKGKPIKTIEFKQGINGQYVRNKTIQI